MAKPKRLAIEVDDEITLSADDNEFGLSAFDDDDQPQRPDMEQQAAGAAGSNVEADAQAELSEVLQGFKQRAAREEERFWDAVDTEYWFCLCFQTREQKEEFLRKVGWMEIGDKYLDGKEVAKKLKVKLESRIPTVPQPRAFGSEYLRIAMPLDDDETQLSVDDLE